MLLNVLESRRIDLRELLNVNLYIVYLLKTKSGEENFIKKKIIIYKL